MNQRIALITGANGGIGQVLCSTFKKANWKVIASDQDNDNTSGGDLYVTIELKRMCRDKAYRTEIIKYLHSELTNSGLHVLIHNAASQIVAPVEQLTVNTWHDTMDINLIAPFVLTQGLLPELRQANGSVINIASVHAQLTKPSFVTYATSKAALIGLTKALAVELGNAIRVNAISPAAIITPMLRQGFDKNPHGLDQLANWHPSGCLGTPKDVAKSALFLADPDNTFLNGTIVGLDGGIASRLHDPD